MELIRHEIPVKSRAEMFRVYYLYDWHVGPPGCDYDLLESQVQTVLNDDHGFCVLGGEWFDQRADIAVLCPDHVVGFLESFVDVG